MRQLIAAALACILLPVAAVAEERATTKDAELMVHRAVQFLQTNGREKAFAAFSDPHGPFTFRDLYIVVLDLGAVVRAHGARKDFIGRNFLDVKDADGKAWNRDILAGAKADGKTWVEYKMQNPATGKIERKVAYFERAGDWLVGCGAYLR